VAAPKPVLVEEPAVKKAAQSSSDESSAPKEDTSALKKQIEFLEGKLLEYQIIQDEIASLSTLKQENEKLRQEIMGLQRTATTAPTAAPTPPASAPLEEGPGPTSFSSPQDPSEVSAKNQIDSLIQKIDELSDKK
jgi:cell division septum initiation protein DivIVA